MWVVSPIPLLSSTLLSFTLYLNNTIMRSSNASPPFEQYEDGMVAKRPILEVNTSRLLIEENLPRPTLQEGSTPEMGFVREVVLGHEQKLVLLQIELRALHHLLHEHYSWINSCKTRITLVSGNLEHIIDQHLVPLQHTIYISGCRQCPCGQIQLTECHCGRPKLATTSELFAKYLEPPIAQPRPSSPYPHSSNYPSSSNSASFGTPEEGEAPIPVLYRVEGPSEAETVFLRAALFPEHPNSTGSYEGDRSVSGDGGRSGSGSD